jgi:transcriptional regulator with XRE-family HTH domain
LGDYTEKTAMKGEALDKSEGRASRPSERSVPVKGQEVVRLRKLKGWYAKELASRAGYSLKTIQTIERNNRCAPETLRHVALALDTTYVELVDDEYLRANDFRSVSYGQTPRDVSTTVVGDPTNFDQAQLHDFVEKLKQMIGPHDEILIISVKRGSVIIAYEMSELDSLRLVRAFGQRKLDVLEIERIEIQADSHVMHLIFLELLGSVEPPRTIWRNLLVMAASCWAKFAGTSLADLSRERSEVFDKVQMLYYVDRTFDWKSGLWKIIITHREQPTPFRAKNKARYVQNPERSV